MDGECGDGCNAFQQKPDSVINVKVEFGEGEGKVPLDNVAKRARSGQTRTGTGTVAVRIKNGLSIEGVCSVPLVKDWKMNTMRRNSSTPSSMTRR